MTNPDPNPTGWDHSRAAHVYLHRLRGDFNGIVQVANEAVRRDRVVALLVAMTNIAAQAPPGALELPTGFSWGKAETIEALDQIILDNLLGDEPPEP